jgi:hypothetical protein
MTNRSTTSTPESRGQLAYTAYGKSVGFKTHDGKDLPMFHELGDPQRQGFIAAADVIWQLATTGSATI